MQPPSSLKVKATSCFCTVSIYRVWHTAGAHQCGLNSLTGHFPSLEVGRPSGDTQQRGGKGIGLGEENGGLHAAHTRPGWSVILFFLSGGTLHAQWPPSPPHCHLAPASKPLTLPGVVTHSVQLTQRLKNTGKKRKEGKH